MTGLARVCAATRAPVAKTQLRNPINHRASNSPRQAVTATFLFTARDKFNLESPL